MRETKRQRTCETGGERAREKERVPEREQNQCERLPARAEQVCEREQNQCETTMNESEERERERVRERTSVSQRERL